ncbi:hypothetical protein Tco_0848980, partial [Tanacetum coccineum]
MDLETAKTNAAAKLPLLKQGEYEMWRLRIEQYFQIQDYALWDVIANGNSSTQQMANSTCDGTSTLMIPCPVTTEENAQKKNDVKARSMLLMALPNEHQLTFNQYKDAKTLFATIQTIFGVLQKLLAVAPPIWENISQEDLNLKFLRSLPSEWNTHIVVWRNKTDLETMSFNDLYNNFQEFTNEANTVNVQVSTANSSVSTDSTLDKQIHKDDLEEIDLKWQLALLSMRARKYYQRTGKKITINGSPRNQESRPKNQDSSRRTVNVEDTSSKAMVAINRAGFDWSFMAEDEVTTNMTLMAFSDSEVYNDKSFSNTSLKSFEALKTQLDNLIVEFNKSEFNLATYKRGLTSVEEQLVFYKKNKVMFCDQIDVLKRDALFKDSGIIALKSEIEKLKKEKDLFLLTIDLSNSGLEEFQQPEFKGYGPKASKSVCVDTSNEVKKTSDTPLVEELVSEKEKQSVFPKQQDKTARKPVKYAEMYRLQKPRGNQRNWNNLKSQQL